MFVFGLKKTEFWVTLTLLLLCLSVCPHSTHSHFEEAEESMDVEAENVENEEDDREAVQDEDEDSEEEDDLVEDAADIENAPTTKPGDPYPGNPDPPVRARVCKKVTEDCDWPYNCCPGLTCTELKCVSLKPDPRYPAKTLP